MSIASDGAESENWSGLPIISSDDRYVTFGSWATNLDLVPEDTNGTFDIFVHDRQTGTTERVSIASDGTEANDFSGNPFISADVRYVAFGSEATNLVPNDTNGYMDIFVVSNPLSP